MSKENVDDKGFFEDNPAILEEPRKAAKEKQQNEVPPIPSTSSNLLYGAAYYSNVATPWKKSARNPFTLPHTRWRYAGKERVMRANRSAPNGTITKHSMMGRLNKYFPSPTMLYQTSSFVRSENEGTPLIEPAIPIRKTIRLTKSVLYPPRCDAPPSEYRKKPPGCKTIFIGHLPEGVTEEIIKEAFEQFGEVSNIEMNGDNFCYLSFVHEDSADKAVSLSGYRMKVENKYGETFSGRLRVFYSQTKKNRVEFESKHEKLGRKSHSCSSPRFIYDNVKEMITNLRDEKGFKDAVFVLISWLKEGVCDRKNSAYFFSMIQSTNSRIHKFLNDKAKYVRELNLAKKKFQKKLLQIYSDFSSIENIFEAARSTKCWAHFTKVQCANIELWHKHTSEFKEAIWDELIEEHVEDMMCDGGQELGTDDSDQLIDKKSGSPTLQLKESGTDSIVQQIIIPAPLLISQYSENEASLIVEKLGSNVEYKNAIEVLTTWLERGDCDRKTASSFYSMIQYANSCIYRLLNEKAKYETELGRAKNHWRQKLLYLYSQFCKAEKVFEAAKLKKCWDHFTKVQRKSIESWKQEVTEIKNVISKELNNECIEDMEISNKDEKNHINHDQHETCEKSNSSLIAPSKNLQEQLGKDALCPSTSQTVIDYSEHEARIITNKIQTNLEFKTAIPILVAWLKGGKCTKDSSASFYDMIQTANDYVRRLLNEKAKCEDVVIKAKNKLRQKMLEVCLHFNDVEEIFEAVESQNCWLNFTESQRKDIELCKKHMSEIKKSISDELVDERVEDTMEVCEEDDDGYLRHRTLVDGSRLALFAQEIEKRKGQKKKEMFSNVTSTVFKTFDRN